MIGRGPPPSLWSVPRAVVHGRALRLDVLTHPTQLLTNETNIIYSLIMLTLGPRGRAILSRLNRRQTLTELPGQLVQIIAEVGAVMIRDLLPGGLGGLVHGIDPAPQTRGQSLELHGDDTADRDTESRERGHDLGGRHDGD